MPTAPPAASCSMDSDEENIEESVEGELHLAFYYLSLQTAECPLRVDVSVFVWRPAVCAVRKSVSVGRSGAAQSSGLYFRSRAARQAREGGLRGVCVPLPAAGEI